MEKELKEMKKEIVKLKVRIFDLETNMNNTIDKLEIIHSLVSKAKKLLEMDKEW